MSSNENATQDSAQGQAATQAAINAQLSPESELITRTMAEVKQRSIDWLWKGWIPRKYVTLAVGEPGAAKSTSIADIVGRITTGRPWPGEDHQNLVSWRQPGRVLWLGSEDGAEDMTAPRLTACGANLGRVIEIRGVKIMKGGRATFSMQDDLNAVRTKLLHARDVELDPIVAVVVDPITSYLNGRRKLAQTDLRDAGQLRSILEPWFVLIQEFNIALIVVTHFNKDTTRSMLHRVLGSQAFVAMCRSLLAFVDRSEEGEFEKAMLQAKNNLPEHPGGAWRFKTERMVVGTDSENGRDIVATRSIWSEQDQDITPDSVMGGTRGPVSKTKEVFAMFIRSHFKEYDARFKQEGEYGGLKVEDVKASALRMRVCGEAWWEKNSSDTLEKQNFGGIWWCRPK